MSFALLYPAALAALAALLIPISMHLIRRAEYRLTPFAAMRWIRSQLRQQQRLRLRDVPLLLLRLLLLGLIALLLAQPVLRGDSTAAAHWVLVAPGSDVGDARERISDSDADWRWLAPGFPAVGGTAAPATSDSASLLRELDAELPSSSRISVVVPNVVDGLDGERPSLSRDVEWIVVDGEMPAPVKPTDDAATQLLVRYDDAGKSSLAYIDALEKAWRVAYPELTIAREGTDAALPGDARWLLWLSPERPQALLDWVADGGSAIATASAKSPDANRSNDDVKNEQASLAWRDQSGNVIASGQRIDKGRLIQLQGGFAPDALPALLDPEFPTRLHDVFAGEAAAPTRGVAAALRPAVATNASNISSSSQATRSPLDVWFALAIAILFAIERIWASRLRRGVSS